MREIKFRCYWHSLKAMFYFGSPFDAGIIMPGDGKTIYPVSREVMEFTGIKDKNGKEIYEGDIIKTDYGFVATVE